MRSAHSSPSMPSCMSSVITHLPGVLFQQAKQPLQEAIFFSERFICLISASLSISKMPSRNALESFNVLLRSPFGLPLIKRIFIPISIPRALCAEGTARRTSSSSLRSWLLCVACDTVSLMFSIAHPNIRCIVILVKSEKNTHPRGAFIIVWKRSFLYANKTVAGNLPFFDPYTPLCYGTSTIITSGPICLIS